MKKNTSEKRKIGDETIRWKRVNKDLENDDDKNVGEEEINLAVSMARAGTRLN